MSIVTPPSIKVGNQISAADINQYFTDLSTASANLQTDNTKSENISQFHLDFTNNPTTGYYDEIAEWDGGQVVNWNTYQLVNFTTSTGLTPFQSVWSPTGIVLRPGDTLRLHFDVWVDDVTLDLEQLPNITYLGEDCYKFQFWTSDDNGVTFTPFGPESVYSVTTIPWPAVTALVGGPVETAFFNRKRVRQKVNLTHCHINTTQVNQVFDVIQVRVKIQDLTVLNQIELKYGTFNVLVGRN